MALHSGVKGRAFLIHLRSYTCSTAGRYLFDLDVLPDVHVVPLVPNVRADDLADLPYDRHDGVGPLDRQPLRTQQLIGQRLHVLSVGFTEKRKLHVWDLNLITEINK